MDPETPFSDRPLTSRQYSSLPTNIAKPPNDHLIPFDKAVKRIGYIHLITKFLDQFLRSP